ncbi:MAG: hypothetical protein FWE07_02155 [Turicibacter sp.]|nr:hypothetical protein [Turicibacter sp.]
MTKVTMKYDKGIKKEEVVALEIPAAEFETMLENDYQERLAYATDGEVVERRTPQAIFDELNRKERNSWQTHTRHQHQFQMTLEIEDETSIETHTMDRFIDDSQAKERQRQEDYEALCQKLRGQLNPDQVEMIIAICLDGMSVKDYAAQIDEKPNTVTKRFMRIKNFLKENL